MRMANIVTRLLNTTPVTNAPVSKLRVSMNASKATTVTVGRASQLLTKVALKATTVSVRPPKTHVPRRPTAADP